MKLFWTHEALDDRRTIYSYIEAENPRAALQLDALFAEKSASLLQHPKLGRAGRILGTRELIVHRNYFLVYHVVGISVRILRLMHAAQKYES